MFAMCVTERQTACKPGSVPPPEKPRRRWPFIWDVRYRTPRATDPSGGAKARPARRRTGGACRSYLVLLPVGFALPPPLPAARCALTAPFHPCLPCRPMQDRPGSAVCFCGTFPGVAPAGRYPAPCLRGARTFLPPLICGERPSGRLAWDDMGRHRPKSKQVRPCGLVRPARTARR